MGPPRNPEDPAQVIDWQIFAESQRAGPRWLDNCNRTQLSQLRRCRKNVRPAL